MGLFAISAATVFPKLVSWLKETNKQTSKQQQNEWQSSKICALRVPGNEYFPAQSSHSNTFSSFTATVVTGRFSLRCYFTTTTRILFVFPFLLKFCNPSE